MSERTLVPIFFFWALLTIITPTLILLSENSKADLDVNGNATEGMKARRMISYTEYRIIRTPPSVAEEELASAPAPAPSVGTRTRATPTWSHSDQHHNHTLTSSNKTDDSATLSSTNIRLKVNQTDIRIR